MGTLRRTKLRETRVTINQAVLDAWNAAIRTRNSADPERRVEARVALDLALGTKPWETSPFDAHEQDDPEAWALRQQLEAAAKAAKAARRVMASSGHDSHALNAPDAPA